MKSRLDNFRQSLICAQYDVVIIVESWLNVDITPAEMQVRGYNIFRTDRSLHTSIKKRGGGVLIAVRESFDAVTLNEINVSVEQLFVRVTLKNLNVIFGAVYIPPNSDTDKYEAHCATLETLYAVNQNSDFLLFGDYNLPEATWFNDNLGLMVNCPPNSHANVMAETFGFLNLFQINTIPNRRNVFLDLIFSSIQRIVVSIACDALFPNSTHHVALEFEIPIDKYCDYLRQDEYYRDYKNTNFIGLNNFLVSMDWGLGIQKSASVDEAAEFLYSILNQGLDRFVPRKRFVSTNFPNWYSPELKKSIINKKTSHKKFKQTGEYRHYHDFTRMRARCKALLSECYAVHIDRLNNSLQDNPRRFWSFVNNKRKIYNFPQNMILDGTEGSDNLSIANLFSKYFSSVFQKSKTPTMCSTNCNGNEINIVCNKISVSEVYDAICHLPDKMSAGPDDFPNYLLKRCITTLTSPLTDLFNRSLNDGVFPLLFKKSYLNPIYKSGDNNNIKNYRSVCNQSSIPKLFDLLVYRQLSWSCRSLISSRQHGFSRGRSTDTNLVVYESHLLRALEEGAQVDAIYTDFSKAFDRVDHELLLIKLRAVGFGDLLMGWFKTYLEGREYLVKIGNVHSNGFTAVSGVPQGAHCSPLLFNLFVNDIASNIVNSDFLMFADDLKVFKRVSNDEDAQDLQADLDRLVGWTETNCLLVNVSKCGFVSFFRGHRRVNVNYVINGTVLDNLSMVKDLGVIFDSRLSFCDHYVYIINKASKVLGLIYRNLGDLSLQSLRILYCALVRSVLESSSVVWSPLYEIHKYNLEKIQNRFLRLCAYKRGLQIVNHDYSVVRRLMNLSLLADRRVVNDQYFLYKIINGFIECPTLLSSIRLNVPQRHLRQVELFSVDVHRTNYGSHSPLLRAMTFMNRHQELDIFSSSPSSFKRSTLSLVGR